MNMNSEEIGTLLVIHELDRPRDGAETDRTMTASNKRSVLAIGISIIAMWGFSPWSTTAMGAPSYCAFDMKVSKPSGAPFANVPGGMVEKGIQVATVVTDANGKASFCDAPLHAVDIVIGTQDCGVVLVRGVKPTWPVTREIFVTYDRAHCGELVFPDHCQVLLRIKDEEGRPLAGTEFGSGRSERDVSDVFGRIFRSIRSGEKLEGVLRKEGREPVHISERCVQEDERDVERDVVLRKTGR